MSSRTHLVGFGVSILLINDFVTRALQRRAAVSGLYLRQHPRERPSPPSADSSSCCLFGLPPSARHHSERLYVKSPAAAAVVAAAAAVVAAAVDDVVARVAAVDSPLNVLCPPAARA